MSTIVSQPMADVDSQKFGPLYRFWLLSNSSSKVSMNSCELFGFNLGSYGACRRMPAISTTKDGIACHLQNGRHLVLLKHASACADRPVTQNLRMTRLGALWRLGTPAIFFSLLIWRSPDEPKCKVTWEPRRAASACLRLTADMSSLLLQ